MKIIDPDDARSEAERLALAMAVARPRRRVWRLNEQNEQAGTMSLEAAVAQDECFFVEVSGDIIALDFDDSDAELEADLFHRRLLVMGERPVLLASGQIGRRHIFCRVRDRELVLRKLGLGVKDRRVRSTIRPPGVIHRSRRGRSRLIEPINVSEAVGRLTTEHARRAMGSVSYLLGARQLPERRSSSELVHSLAMSAYQAGWTLEDFQYVLASPATPLRDLIAHRLNRTTRVDWFQRTWGAAAEQVRDNPPRQPNGIAESVRRDLAWTAERSWSGRTGPTDFRVMCALISKSAMCGAANFDMSVREIAEAAGVSSLSTTTHALRRLMQVGLITRQMASPVVAMRESSSWELRIDHGDVRPISHRKFEECLAAVGSDTFRNKVGLGGVHLRIYISLIVSEALSLTELCGLSARSRGRIASALRDLEALDLARREAGLWRRGPGDLRVVAKELGADGRGEQQSRLHEMNRRGRDEAVQRYYELKRGWNT